MVPLMRRRVARMQVNLVMDASRLGFDGGDGGDEVVALSFLWVRLALKLGWVFDGGLGCGWVLALFFWFKNAGFIIYFAGVRLCCSLCFE